MASNCMWLHPSMPQGENGKQGCTEQLWPLLAPILLGSSLTLGEEMEAHSATAYLQTYSLIMCSSLISRIQKACTIIKINRHTELIVELYFFCTIEHISKVTSSITIQYNVSPITGETLHWITNRQDKPRFLGNGSQQASNLHNHTMVAYSTD